MRFATTLAALAVISSPVQTSEQPIRVSPDGRTHVQILLESGQASMSRITAFPGAAIPEHAHEGSDELLLIEEGSGEMTLGAERITVGPGQAIRIPKGVKHSFKHTGKGPLRATQVYAPPGPEQRFKKWKELR